ncbi:unnamed protein product [Lymnaea stagnalis]|uniref:Uncharacterized protein n=1 Tax=Lymnaea stagnalis TaxID=6523 RepID=A0AAV2IEC7_LYMST
MPRLTFYLVFLFLHLLTIQQYVTCATVLSNHDPDVQELLDNGKLSDECKGLIKDNVLSTSSQQWCNMFDAYKPFIVDSNGCDGTEYESLTRAACTKEDPVVMTTQTPMATTPTPAKVTQPSSMPTAATTKITQSSSTSTTATTKIKQVSLTPPHSVTPRVPTTDRPVTVTPHSGVTDTSKSVQDSIQTNVSVTPTARHGVTNTIKNVQQALLQQLLNYRIETVHFDQCKAAALTKLTKGDDVSRLCATIKQFKAILDDKCVKTDYDLLVVETLQLFGCLVCPL